jgi:hypothetical protein
MDKLADSDWLFWLENSGLSSLIQQWIWFYPLVETLHILGFATLFGSVAMFDLRLLGYSRQVLVTDMAQHLLPWTYISFGVVVLSGFLMFVVDAPEIAANPAFRLKLLLIAAAGINAVVFHARHFQSVKRWNRGIAAPVMVKAIALLSLILWTAAIACGRAIAYL